MSNRKRAVLVLAATGAFAFGFAFALGLSDAGSPVEGGGNTKPATRAIPTAQPTAPEPAVVSDEAIQRREEHPRPAAADKERLVAGLYEQIRRARKGD